MWIFLLSHYGKRELKICRQFLLHSFGFSKFCVEREVKLFNFVLLSICEFSYFRIMGKENWKFVDNFYCIVLGFPSFGLRKKKIENKLMQLVAKFYAKWFLLKVSIKNSQIISENGKSKFQILRRNNWEKLKIKIYICRRKKSV